MKDAAYWLSLAHLPRWGHLRINNLIIKFYHENQISVEDFFQLSENDWRTTYLLDTKQISDLQQAKSELASNAFLAESLFNQGYELIPITSPEFSKTLKGNLKAAHSPSLLYVKGNKLIMTSAIDNLVKGAAGQAIQNMNIMFGLPEITGLQFPGLHP